MNGQMTLVPGPHGAFMNGGELLIYLCILLAAAISAAAGLSAGILSPAKGAGDACASGIRRKGQRQCTLHTSVFALLLLLITAAVMLSPAPAGAADPAAEVNGRTYASLKAAIAAASNGDTVRLLKDINRATEDPADGAAYLVEINKTITLNLNGWMIDAEGRSTVLYIGGNANVTVTDSDPTRNSGITYTDPISGQSVTVTGGVITGGSMTNYGGGVYIDSHGCLSMDSGAIVGNTSGKTGGGVFAEYGSFIMSGGLIAGNKASVAGGGVLIYGGSFNMSGGAAISGNTAGEDGGGVYLIGYQSSIFEMSGSASVSGNTAANGGGVCVPNESSFIMSGSASVSGNKASLRGGGVFVTGGSFSMSENASVSGNTADYGGGVSVTSDGSFDMSGSASVSGNSAYIGGGVDVYGSLSMSENASVSGNEANTQGGGVYVTSDGSFDMSGAASVSGNTVNETTKNNIYLPDGKLITVSGELTNGASIGVTMAASSGIFTTGYSDDNTGAPSAYFTSDNTDLGVVLYGGEAALISKNTVSYDGNGATGGEIPTDGNRYVPGDPVMVAGKWDLERIEGDTVYFFSGWTTDQNGEGTVYSPGDTYTMGDGAVVFYARWKAPVAQVRNKNYPSLKEAIAAASSGDTVMLLKDVNRTTEEPADGASYLVEIRKNIRLNLNGWTINAEGRSGVLYIGAGVNVTMRDSMSTRAHEPEVKYTDPVSGQSVTVTGGVITGGNGTDGAGVVH